MATENDISLDQAQARQWVLDVNNEIVQVETLLSEVAQELQEVVDPDDPIIPIIEKTGQIMQSGWEAMIKEFKNAMSLIDEALEVLRKGFEGAAEIAEGLLSKLK